MQVYKREVRHYISDNGRNLFGDWIRSLKDTQGQISILKRIDRIEEGNFGDRSYIGEGVWELRVHAGPGYRVYYGEEGRVLVILLCGGDKHSQKKDIRRSQELWKTYRRSK